MTIAKSTTVDPGILAAPVSLAEARAAAQQMAVDTMARTLWGEARGEGADGMAAVGCVIRTRAEIAREFKRRQARRHPLFGDGSITSACLMPQQFSCWNIDDPNRSKLLTLATDDATFREAEQIALQVVSGALADMTQGSTHYHTVAPPKDAKVWPPKWAGTMRMTVHIGRHVFYDSRRPPLYGGPADGPGPSNGGTPVAGAAGALLAEAA